VLPKVIDFSQSTFIEGMGMIDNIIIANEVVEEIRRKKKRTATIVKVDYEKAYNLMS